MNLTLSDNRSLRLTTLCVLYVSQGMPDGFVRTGLKTYLIAHGATLAEVAHVIALVSWPWASQMGLGTGDRSLQSTARWAAAGRGF